MQSSTLYGSSHDYFLFRISAASSAIQRYLSAAEESGRNSRRQEQRSGTRSSGGTIPISERPPAVLLYLLDGLFPAFSEFVTKKQIEKGPPVRKQFFVP